MRKCILVPDSFKGTMSSMEVSGIMKECILKYFPQCQVVDIPVADGGEGTVDCFLKALGGKKVVCTVNGPFMEPVTAFYGVFGKTAVIEMAAASGLPLAYGRLNPLTTTTYGVGELIQSAIKRGCNKIILGLGGSCTNDGGAGMAAALGAKFKDNQGKEFIPSGGTLSKVSEIDLTETRRFIEGVEITAMCDIDNPMHGPSGAAFVFAPQKGATESDVEILDKELKDFAKIIKKTTGLDVQEIKGAGAAGAMGAGVYAFLSGKLKQGIDIVLDIVGFESLLSGCDMVFTGEGKLDHQSLFGKVIAGVALKAKEKNIPVIAVVGKMEKNLKNLHEMGIIAVYETGGHRQDFAEILTYCKEDLRRTMEEVIKTMHF